MFQNHNILPWDFEKLPLKKRIWLWASEEIAIEDRKKGSGK